MTQRIVLVFFLITLVTFVKGQNENWEYIDFPFTRYSTNLTCFEDTIDDVTYVIGKYFLPGDSIDVSICSNPLALARYDGSEFEVVGNFGNVIKDAVRYNDFVYVGGHFECVNNEIIRYLARYDGESWSSVGTFNGMISTMCTDGDYLYVAGDFTEINGQEIKRIARYDGILWESVPSGGFESGGLIHKILIFQGELYVSGILYRENLEGYRGVMSLQNDQWDVLNNNENLGQVKIENMAVWNDKLYLAGNFFLINDYLHEALIAWDGEQVSAPWPGFYFFNGQVGFGSTVQRLSATPDYLYVSGRAEFIGDMEVNQMAAFNGNEWCAMYTEGLQQPMYGMFTFRDTAYSFQDLNPFSSALYPTGLYKWIGGANMESCLGLTTTSSSVNPTSLLVYPNPVISNVTIDSSSQIGGIIKLSSLRGEAVIPVQYLESGRNISLELSDLSSGLYLLQLFRNDGLIETTKLLKL